MRSSTCRVLCTTALMMVAAVSSPQGLETIESSHLAASVLPYPEPPYQYEGSRFLAVTFTTTPEVVRALVPEPLVPNEKGIVHLLVARQQMVSPLKGAYLEAMLSIPAALGEIQGGYMPVLYLDEAVAIIAGREVYGFPKVDADIEWSEDGDTVQATVVRDGVSLIDLKMQLAPPLEQIPDMPASPSFNVKHIPSVEAGAKPALKQLTATTLEDLEILVMRPGAAELELGSSARDPLGSIPVLAIVGAAYSEQRFVLPHGTVVHDYLAPVSPPEGE